MKWMALGVLLLTGCSAAREARVLRPSDPSLEAVAFLSGSWSSEQLGLRFDEHWAPPSGGTMLGVSRVVNADQTVFHEFVLIERTAEGTFFRVRTESAEAAVSFRLVPSEKPGRITFENPSHDYPTRIHYWLEGDSTLRARIEGTKDGKPASDEFLYYRSVVAAP